MRRKFKHFWRLRGLLLALGILLLTGALGLAQNGNYGAVWTSDEGGDVNINIYPSKEAVYLNGGPHNNNGKGLPDGMYACRVTIPNGDVILGRTDGTPIQVSNGVIPQRIQLWSIVYMTDQYGTFLLDGAGQKKPGYLDTTNGGGEYKAIISMDGFDDIKTDNFKVAGSISGLKYNDLDGDGVRDDGEYGMAGWTIVATDNATGQRTTVTTGTNGLFSLQLAPGTYSVHEVMTDEQLADRWVHTQPSASGGYDFTVVIGGQDTGNLVFGNHQQDEDQFEPGTIWGVKFNDLDGDGVKDAGEPLLSDWTITLTDATGAEISTLTDANGVYAFTGLLAGAYTVAETPQDGWQQTCPANPGTWTFTIATSGQVETADFGNFKLGSIAGMKFEDMDGNGVKDEGDTGLAGWEITLSDGQVATTDADGAYSFTGLKAGTYTVAETPQDGWTQTSAAPAPVVITSGKDATGVDFGNFKLGRISGVKFEDVNGNGTKDTDEPVLAGWEISLNDGTPVVTGEDGAFTFDGLLAGTYALTENGQDGWRQTLAPEPIKITSGTAVDNADFGNFKLGKITGMKFEDMNGNGVKDEGDKGLAGWEITLSDGQVATTDADGAFTFSGLFTGTYLLKETQQDGWQQTLAPDAAVIDTSGQVVADADFGNFKLGKISGVKFEDVNGNGTKDAGEPVLAGWEISLNGGAPVTTGEDGAFTFDGLFAGTYTLTETLRGGWKQTLAPDAIAVTSGTVVDDANFGNFKLGTIAGVKFYDANGNGVKDAGEQGLPNWKILLSNGAVAWTDASGAFIFKDLDQGSYTVAEAMPTQTNWRQTAPAAPGTFPVTIATSGTVVDGLAFGNLARGTGGGRTVGFWSNKNGQLLVTADRLALLCSLHLVTANGSAFDPASWAALSTWLLNATATNAAYMLSAQLAAMELNVASGKVNSASFIYAPGTTSANAGGYATVSAVMAEANTELGLHSVCLANSPYRAYQLALKTALDNANQDASTTFILMPPPAFSF